MQYHTKKLALLLAICAAMFLAAPAFAAGGNDGYKNGGENVAGDLQPAGEGVGGEATSPQNVSSGSGSGGALPFTGLDLALLFGAGGVLTAVGLGTRRLTRHADTA